MQHWHISNRADPMTTENRAALILKLARRILRAGWARGWSDALRQAREQCPT